MAELYEICPHALVRYLIVEADIDEVLVPDFGELFDGGCVALAYVVCIHLALLSHAATAPGTPSRYTYPLTLLS